jgi:Rrf2 family protein
MSYSLAFSQSLFVVFFVAGKISQGEYDFIPTQKISEILNIPPSTTGVILRRLNRARLIESREGVNGGVRLTRQPEEITLLDVFLAIEQERPMFQTSIQLGVTGEKPTRIQQTIVQKLIDAETAMKDDLKKTTIRDLMNALKG